MLLHFNCVILVFIALSNLLHKLAVVICIPTLNGRYTRELDDFMLVVPFKVFCDGTFSSYKIPHFYEHNFEKRRSKRSMDDPEMLHYVIAFQQQEHHVDLWPNHGFISPDVVSESYEPKLKVQHRKLKRLGKDKMCHYTGNVRGQPQSRVALSACDGLAGYVTIGDKRYFIEPVHEHIPNRHGQHLHVIYQRDAHENNQRKSKYSGNQCGTKDNWEDAWKKRFFDKILKEEGFEKVKRGSSLQRYLEVLVVCDKKFIEYHKVIDMEQYVLTVMNMVSDYYHDASSGNQMDVVVVRIMYLDKEEEEVDLMINPNADDTLASFCKWQQKVNPKDMANPNHHDIAVLLTRYDICSDNMSNCGLMGLAYMASACTGDQPCAINEDGGLVLGIVVAHEMGHVMGCAHDKEGESSCAAQDSDESFFVMAPFVHLFTTRWSPCSRGFMTALLDNNLGDCLNDEPQVSLYKTEEMLPGAVYDADAQCRFAYPNSKVCRMNQDTFCEMLLCQTSPTECMSNEEPPADGTKCGENMWCYRKKCVPIGGRPEAINGGWGEWSSWSKCSRTCGGGVSVSERQCNNPTPEHRGRYCIGEKQKTKICNFDPCPAGSQSFRDVQCQEFNSQNWNGKGRHQWKAYLVPDEACVLYCLNEENVFAKLEPRVKDGTPCKPGTKDLCIGGICKKVGCDGQVDSDAVEDICGICKGDGTECKIIENTYKEPGEGYKEIAKIPKGARSVIVEELDSSANTIALSDAGKKRYYLNADFSEQSDGPITIGEQASAVTGLYSHPEPQKEHLDIHGPLPEDLLLYVVFYRPENVGYHYKWAEPGAGGGGGSSGYKPQYHWEQVDWEDCSANCGGGFQKAKFSCIEDKAGKVGDNLCESLEKPEEITRKCNEQPCKTKWKVGNWGKCHACKYKSGVRMREVECIKESPHSGAEDILTEDSECKGPKPGTRELCNSHKKCKSRRFTDGLPDEMMEEIWKQINGNRRKRFMSKHLTIPENDATNSKYMAPFDLLSDDVVDKKIPDMDICSDISNGVGKNGSVKSQHQEQPKSSVGATMKDKIPKNENNQKEECSTTTRKDLVSFDLSSYDKLIGNKSPDISGDVGNGDRKSEAKFQPQEPKVNVEAPLKYENPINEIKPQESNAANNDELFHFDLSSYDKLIDKKLPVNCGDGSNVDGKSGVKSQQQGQIKLNVGKTIKDRIPKNEIRLILVPLKPSHLSVDLSDDAFETMGDKVSDSLDTGKAKIATGDAAVKILKGLQHEQPEKEDHENKGHKQ